jgi:hypothetical protein
VPQPEIFGLEVFDLAAQIVYIICHLSGSPIVANLERAKVTS